MATVCPKFSWALCGGITHCNYTCNLQIVSFILFFVHFSAILEKYIFIYTKHIVYNYILYIIYST